MDILVFVKQAADLGISAPLIVAIGIYLQQIKTNYSHDKRISILESH